jgi:hypothetical protein
VGTSEGEKLLNRQRDLERELNALDQKGGAATDNDLARGERLVNELLQTRLAIQDRLIAQRGEEKQIIMDTVREQNKALLFAGPGEMLKRLYVGGLLNRKQPISTGEFMSLDPESRRLYYEGRGGDAGARLREDRARLKGLGLTPEQEAAMGLALGQQSAGYRGRLDANTGKRMENIPVGDKLPAQAKAAGEQLGVLQRAAGGAAAALARLPLIVDGLVQQAIGNIKAPRPAVAGGMDLDAGVSLGAGAPEGSNFFGPQGGE